MAHYAFLNDKNIVTEVIVGKDEKDVSENWEEFYGNIRGQRCKRTSFNSIGGSYRDPVTNDFSIDTRKCFRKNYAAIGYFFDEARDAFIPPKPFDSWQLNEFTCQWEAPVIYPNDGKIYNWNEKNVNWEEVKI